MEKHDVIVAAGAGVGLVLGVVNFIGGMRTKKRVRVLEAEAIKMDQLKTAINESMIAYGTAAAVQPVVQPVVQTAAPVGPVQK